MVWAIKKYILDVTRHVEVWGQLIARYFRCIEALKPGFKASISTVLTGVLVPL